MLSRQLVRASPFRTAAAAMPRLPIVQQRTFLPPSMTGKDVVETKYPEYPNLTEAEDPNMVRRKGHLESQRMRIGRSGDG